MTALAPLLTVALTALAAPACVQATGESKLAGLQSDLDHEFPDHGPLAEVSPPATHAAPAAEAKPTGPAPEGAGMAIAPTGGEASATIAPVVDTGSAAARPVIRIVGTGKSRVGGHVPDDHVEVTLPGEGALSAPAPTSGQGAAKSAVPTDPTAKQEYDRALALLNARDYDHALEAFGAFLARWPDEAGAEGAMFWSGESYLAKGDLLEAAMAFERALAHFPHGTRVPDVLLKLGVCARRLGDQAKARAYFERLALEFPKSDATRRIPRDGASAL